MYSARLWVLALLLTPSHIPAQDTKAAPSTPIWSFEANDNIRLIRSGAFGQPVVFVGTKRQLICLDRATGQPIWSRDDVGALAAYHRLDTANALNGDTLDRYIGLTVRDGQIEKIELRSQLRITVGRIAEDAHAAGGGA